MFSGTPYRLRRSVLIGRRGWRATSGSLYPLRCPGRQIPGRVRLRRQRVVSRMLFLIADGQSPFHQLAEVRQ